MKRPAFQFYPADWRKDAALQSCSIAARGLWHEMLCIMHECVPYGHLCINGAPIKEQQAARLCGVGMGEYTRLMGELLGAGVASVTPEGVMFSRRMVKDEHIRTVRAEAGKLGGNPNLLNLVGKQTLKQVPTPSSSSSSSSKKQKPSRTALPEWMPLETWGHFCDFRKSIKGWTPHAEKLLVTKLGELRAAGHDPKAVIEQSIAGSYRGFWPIKQARIASGGAIEAWWSSDAATCSKGSELGLTARPGEAMVNFRGRIAEAIKDRREVA